MADALISPDQIAEARAAGYSDDEIVSHLASKSPEKFKAAKDAGYSASEILTHLSGAKSAPVSDGGYNAIDAQADAPKEAPEETSMLADVARGAVHGVKDAGRGLASTAKNVGGVDVGDADKADPNYVPANVTNGSWNPLRWNYRQIPKMIGEQSPMAAASAASGTVGAGIGSFVGPVGTFAGALLGGALPFFATSAGDNTKARAVNRTGDQNAVPSTQDKVIGGLTSAASAVPAALMHSPELGPAVSAGLNGVVRSGANLVTRGAVGAAGGVASNAVTQAGTKIGTDAPFDPSALPEAAVGGAASVTPHIVPAIASANRALRMGKYNADPEAAANYATRLQNTGLDFNDRFAGAEAHGKVKADVQNELKDALTRVAQQKALSPEQDNVVTALKRGDNITPKDLETLQTATANTPDGDNAHFLARTLKTAQQAEGEGSFDPKNGWQGSATGGMKGVVRGVFNPWHIGGTMAGMGALAFGMPHVSGAIGGGLMGGLALGMGGARLLDSVTGGSRPSANFVKTFADHNAQLRLETNPPPAQPAPPPQAPSSPWGPRPPMTGPTGPQVAPPAAPAPAPPQLSPIAMSMLKKQLATPLPAAPLAPAPAAPAAPTFSPVAMAMLKQKLKAGLPPEPEAAPTPPPAPPELPTFNPVAMAMLQKKLKAGLPPEAQAAPTPPQAPPAQPTFSPIALAMLQKKLKQGLPPEPQSAPAAAAPSTPVASGPVMTSMADVLRASQERAAAQAEPVKIKKTNGKVKTEAPKVEAPKAEEASTYEPLDEEQLYPKDISAKAYAVREAQAYGAKSPAYLAKAEHSAQKRIDAEHALVTQYPEYSNAIKGLVRQLHKIGSNPKERNSAIAHYASFLSPAASSAVESAFK